MPFLLSHATESGPTGREQEMGTSSFLQTAAEKLSPFSHHVGDLHYLVILLGKVGQCKPPRGRGYVTGERVVKDEV